MKIKIRKAQLKDLKEIVKIAAETIKFHSKYEPELYNVNKSISFYTKCLKEAIQDKKVLFFVAQHKNKICGYVYGDIKPWYPGYNISNVVDLIVNGDYRGKGIGKALLKKIILSFKKKGCKQAIIQVEVKNKKALVLYSSLGFKKWKYWLKKSL